MDVDLLDKQLCAFFTQLSSCFCVLRRSLPFALRVTWLGIDEKYSLLESSESSLAARRATRSTTSSTRPSVDWDHFSVGNMLSHSSSITPLPFVSSFLLNVVVTHL